MLLMAFFFLRGAKKHFWEGHQIKNSFSQAIILTVASLLRQRGGGVFFNRFLPLYMLQSSFRENAARTDATITF